MDTMKTLNSVALLFASIGAINWGLAAFANVDLVAAITAGTTNMQPSMLGNVLYALVAVFGVYTLYMFFQSVTKN
jgi:uncharacterized membrane protein YuzA (DUF378 family)